MSYQEDESVASTLTGSGEWTCSFCHTAKLGSVDCCGIPKEEHFQAYFWWLANILILTDAGTCTNEEMEFMSYGEIVKMLLSPHSWEGMGMLAPGWQPPKL